MQHSGDNNLHKSSAWYMLLNTKAVENKQYRIKAQEKRTILLLSNTAYLYSVEGRDEKWHALQRIQNQLKNGAIDLNYSFSVSISED